MAAGSCWAQLDHQARVDGGQPGGPAVCVYTRAARPASPNHRPKNPAAGSVPAARQSCALATDSVAAVAACTAEFRKCRFYQPNQPSASDQE